MKLQSAPADRHCCDGLSNQGRDCPRQSDSLEAQEQQISGDAEVLRIIAIGAGTVFGLVSAGWLIKLAFERVVGS